MFHDPDAFARLSREMRKPLAPGEPVALPSMAELLARIAAAGESDGREPSTVKPPA